MGNIKNTNLKHIIANIFEENSDKIKNFSFEEIKNWLNSSLTFQSKKNRNEVRGGLKRKSNLQKKREAEQALFDINTQ
jgi:ribosomal protein S17E